MDKALPELGQSRHHMRGSIVFLGLKVFFWIFFIETLYASLFYVFIQSESMFGITVSTLAILWGIHTFKFFLLTGVTLKLVIDWATTSYYIADHHLVKYHGILEIDEEIYELRSLRSLKLKEGLIGRFLNYGDLLLTLSSSGYREDITLHSIAHARRYERILREHLRQSAEKFPPTEFEPGQARGQPE